MSTFLRALQTNDILTENGMPTSSSSGAKLVDYYYKMGGMRVLPDKDIVQAFVGALGENPLYTLKALFHSRNIRSGMGERRAFRVIFKYLCNNHPELAIANLINVPLFGRWDDLFEAFDTPVEKYMLSFVFTALRNKDKLCAKWMPRESKSLDKLAKKFMKAFDMSPKAYRKFLAGNTEVVETLMCSQKWGEINYNHVPSKASLKYRKAFSKHDAGRYGEYLSALESGDKSVKINANAVFPCDVIAPYFDCGVMRYNLTQRDRTVEAQWKALPNFVRENGRTLAICDVSGSMAGQPILVSISLGIYLSERMVGPFKDAFITFSGEPKLQYLKGQTLFDKCNELATSKWQMNTDFEAVLRLILNQAKKFNVSPDEMPTSILIISDMQFDQCVHTPSNSAMEMIERMYSEANYQIPAFVFWNVRTSSGVPVRFDKSGTALVSGYSPSVMESIFSKEMTPLSIVLEVLDRKIYDTVVLN